jgi:hypothetical protein
MVRLHAIVLMRLTATASAIVSQRQSYSTNNNSKGFLLAGGWSKKLSTSVQPRRALHEKN